MINRFTFGDVVLLRFPYTDLAKSKQRPGVILKDTNDGDIIVSRITSKEKETEFDLEIQHWEESDLKLPSIIRSHKIATLEKSLVVEKLGKLNEMDKNLFFEKLKALISGN